MRSITRRGLASALSLTLLATLTVAAATPAAAAVKNQRADRIYVLNNNIENLECTYDWTKLLKSVKKDDAYYPDVLTLQQVWSQQGLNQVIALLKAEWGVTYAGELSISDPPKNPNAECPKKGVQANAVLWRTDRFSKHTAYGVTRWDSDAKVKNSNGSWSGCKNLFSEDFSNQDRAKNIAVALKDNKANKSVVVASLHWPVGQGVSTTSPSQAYDAHACAKENMIEADAALERLRTGNGLAVKTAKVIGGDMNANTSINGWWNHAKGLGYIDPIAKVCGQTNGADFTKCRGTAASGVRNSGHRTTALNRIDYILLKNSTTTNAADTIKQPTSGKLYSNHRAIRATVKY